jgi:D-alanyl-D-alanine carboxypeptidase/D-alanyl-D-alanine-endopeptidase (penicillin-binding protein 4)
MKGYHRKFFLVAGWLLGAALAACAQGTNAARTVAQLREHLAARLAEPKFSAAAWGVKVVSLDSGETLFEDHGDRRMSPASNSKLYTGALALAELGGAGRIATPVYAAGEITRGGALRGDLVIVGHGDPSWNERRLGTNFWVPFEPFINLLTNAGVRRIEGDVVADATFFRGQPTGASWTIDDLRAGEAGLISALTLDDNVAQVRVEPGAQAGARCAVRWLEPGTDLTVSNQTTTVAAGGPGGVEVYQPLDSKTVYLLGGVPAGGAGATLDVVVPEPAEWFAAALKLALERQGITVTGRPRALTWPAGGTNDWAGGGAQRLGAVYSPPMRELVANFMKPSQNLEADLLLAQVGELTRGTNLPAGATSEAAGLAAMGDFLTTAGVAAGDVRFDEGSGLSRNNLTTANATVALLQYMAQGREADDFRAALPVAGVDGSLRHRFRDTAAAGRLWAKTGTLRWANALSGYVTTAAGERLAFSFLLNRFAAAPGHSGTEDLDALALELANFAGHSDNSPAAGYAPLGSLLVTQFVSAPFPHPARAAGHRYHDEFYSAAEHYSDSTVAMFVPKHFRAGEKTDFVVHFHGWRHTVAGTLAEYRLVEQFAESGKNAVLIVPQGPRNAADSFGGKLEDTNGFRTFLAEALEKLRAGGVLSGTNLAVGNVILSGHSGGYHVMAEILDHGGMPVREAWLFDALYGNVENFTAWQKAENGRLLDIYTDHGGTKEQAEALMAQYRANGTALFAAEDSKTAPADLETNRLVFLHSDLAHDDVVSKRGAFGEFLKTSCLQND